MKDNLKCLSVKPKPLSSPIESFDHVDHVVKLALDGHDKLAADHLLNKEMIGSLASTIGSITRTLSLEFYKSEYLGSQESQLKRFRIHNVLMQIALNLFGYERIIVGFNEDEVNISLEYIFQTLSELESSEKKMSSSPVAGAVVDRTLSDMKMVMSKFYRSPGSMVSKMAESIEKKVDEENAVSSFLKAAKDEIQGNIYYRLSLSKNRFGNDYALGLRWLRHLGFVQVSTNPVLAAAAYIDDETLWEGYCGESLCADFKTVVNENPKWVTSPETYADEMTMKATEVSVFPNLAIFRPIAIASNFEHGMVSYQLNPHVSSSVEGSLKDALQIYSDAYDFLKRYDSYLLWGYSNKRVEIGRPNLVFKVPGNNSAAIEITSVLESLGIGTNNTETYTVSQEAYLIISKIDGRAKAVKKGFHVTTSYETTMCGRLNDHLREVQAEILLNRMYSMESGKVLVMELAKAFGIKGFEAMSKDTLIRTLSDRKYLSSLTNENFVKIILASKILGSSERDVVQYLERLEDDIGKAGIAVSQILFKLFFTPESRSKWFNYIKQRYGLNDSQADEVLDGIHVLPASKRKPRETLLTLSPHNMTNTEFPNHQANVMLESLRVDFDIKKYDNAVVNLMVDKESIYRLTEVYDIKEDCRLALELTPELKNFFKEVGIEIDIGERGIRPEDWPKFGAVIKTKTEFTNAYNDFKAKVLEFVKKA
ncbi:MAG: transaldolase family protein [Nitrososphaeria archaeon]|nr:transaldolase family protein [Nitrososphaeria archaeon]